MITCHFVQFQKQGKDVEKVKQRLAEIANYVDKVKYLLRTLTWKDESVQNISFYVLYTRKERQSLSCKNIAASRQRDLL